MIARSHYSRTRCRYHIYFSWQRRWELPSPLRGAMSHVVVGSVGPLCSQALRELGVPVDLEPHHPKMGQLVAEAAQQARTSCWRRSPPEAMEAL